MHYGAIHNMDQENVFANCLLKFGHIFFVEKSVLPLFEISILREKAGVKILLENTL